MVRLIVKQFWVLFVFVGMFSYAQQQNVLNAKTPQEIGKVSKLIESEIDDKPLPYGFVDDRDILWSVMVWETIDLNEKINFPLLYPTDPISVEPNRKSLYDVLVSNIKNGNITEVYTDSYFKEKITFDDLKGSLSKIDTLDSGYDKLNRGETLSKEDTDRRDLTSADIVQYHIKGLWYFDARQGELKYRLLGIAPVAPDVNISSSQTEPALVELFWVWFPQARDVLYKAKTFNASNSARPLSFDHLLNSRMFSTVIYRTDNLQDNRNIQDYYPNNALFQLLESEKIKESIRDREQDMWVN